MTKTTNFTYFILAFFIPPEGLRWVWWDKYGISFLGFVYVLIHVNLPNFYLRVMNFVKLQGQCKILKRASCIPLLGGGLSVERNGRMMGPEGKNAKGDWIPYSRKNGTFLEVRRTAGFWSQHPKLLYCLSNEYLIQRNNLEYLELGEWASFNIKKNFFQNISGVMSLI